MFPRSAGPSEVLTAGAERRSDKSERAASDPVRCHAGRRRTSDGGPSIEHPLEVARLLRTAGCSDVLVAAKRLADDLDRCPITIGHGAIVGQAAIGPREKSGRE
jgi:(p)ppGpp synthase/HD superfamily hydrolase